MSFNIEPVCDAVVHVRHLGEKEEGKQIYRDVSWADVTINGVDLDTTLDNDMKCMESLERNENADFIYEKKNIEVQPRKMKTDILESTSSFKEFKKGDGYKKVYIRQRKVPLATHKKYPTKPRDQSKYEKKKNALERVIDELETNGDLDPTRFSHVAREKEEVRTDERVVQLKVALGEEWWEEILEEHPELDIEDMSVSSEGGIPETSIIDGWFNYGDELGDVQDQMVLSKDPVMVDGLPKWCFHNMMTGEELFMDFEASIMDVYKKWNDIKSKM
jgi:hypothetical protein